jgi:heptosyltransferase-1
LQTHSNFRLLVVRLGAMGDILHALPAVTALRQAHPDWVIDWVVEPHWQALLAADQPAGKDAEKHVPGSALCQGTTSVVPKMQQRMRGALAPEARHSSQPLIDHLHLAPTRNWRKAPFSRQTLHEINALRTAMKDAEYDAVIDLQGAIRSAVLARIACGKRLIGEAEPRERPARWLFSERIATRGTHVIEQDIELASAIAGDQLAPVPPWLPVDPTADAWADEVLPPTFHQPAILINPGAGWGAKRWPVERYAAVAQSLIAHGCRILINVGPGEEPLAEIIVRQTGGAATPLACSLAQLIALTRRISLAIAGDTGPLHLACALERPVVGIYGPTDPSRNGPFGTRFTVLRSPVSRRDHTRYQTPEAGLLSIQPDAVLHAANALLYPETAL